MGDMADDRRWFIEQSEPPQYMRNAVFRNTGTGRFMEIGHYAGLASTDWTWAVKLGDLDTALERQLANFCAVIRGEAEPRVDGLDGLATLAATEAVLESGARGVPVDLT